MEWTHNTAKLLQLQVCTLAAAAALGWLFQLQANSSYCLWASPFHVLRPVDTSGVQQGWSRWLEIADMRHAQQDLRVIAICWTLHEGCWCWLQVPYDWRNAIGVTPQVLSKDISLQLGEYIKDRFNTESWTQ